MSAVHVEAEASAPSGVGRLVGASAATIGLGAAGVLVDSIGGWSGLPGAHLVLVLGVLTLGVLPRLCVTCGGVATADFLVRSLGRLTDSALSSRQRSGGMGVAGVAFGIAVVSTIGGVRLAVDSDRSAHIVVMLAGLCLLIRSRLFSGTWSGLALVYAGITVLGCGVFQLVNHTLSRGEWIAPLASAVLAGLLMAALQGRRHRTYVSPNRVLHWAEATAVTALLCAAAIAAGLVKAIGG
jgi:hypothetical protein